MHLSEQVPLHNDVCITEVDRNAGGVVEFFHLDSVPCGRPIINVHGFEEGVHLSARQGVLPQAHLIHGGTQLERELQVGPPALWTVVKAAELIEAPEMTVRHEGNVVVRVESHKMIAEMAPVISRKLSPEAKKNLCGVFVREPWDTVREEDGSKLLASKGKDDP